MGLLDDAKSGVSKWFEEQVAKNKAFKAAGGMGKSNPAMARSMGLLPTTGLLEQEGDAAARADAAYGALRKEYGPLGLRPGDFVPFASGGLAIDDARLAAAKGNYGQAAGSLAGVIPVAGAVGKVVRKITGGKSSGVVDSVKREISDGPALSVGKAETKLPKYQGEHSAPLKDSGAPLSNLRGNGIYPDDVYSGNAAQYYGSGSPDDASIFSMAKSVQGNPKAQVTVYRAVPNVRSNSAKAADLEKQMTAYLRRNRMPKDSQFKNGDEWFGWAHDEKARLSALPDEPVDKLKINAGDWVTPSLQYAKEHGMGALNNDYKIIKKTVPAGHIFTAGDSIQEFGYDPSAALKLTGQSAILNPEITKAINRGLYRTMLDDEEDKPSFPYGLIGK